MQGEWQVVSMIKIELNKLSIDEVGMMNLMFHHFLEAFFEAEQELVKIMAHEITRTVGGNGPGKPAWRESLKQMVRVVSYKYLDTFMESEIGLDESIGFANYVRAQLIAHGGGSSGPTGVPITAGPPGRSVWDDDLSGKKASQAQSEYTLPAGFNQPGNEFVENAMKRMETYFPRLLRAALRSLPATLMARRVVVSKG